MDCCCPTENIPTLKIYEFSTLELNYEIKKKSFLVSNKSLKVLRLKLNVVSIGCTTVNVNSY